ncbi:MAG: hypothetical protein HKN01_01475 [Acidimicrobiia bacterium]|nr:hypothetical protein [Acidimicrobiia bacterium]
MGGWIFGAIMFVVAVRAAYSSHWRIQRESAKVAEMTTAFLDSEYRCNILRQRNIAIGAYGEEAKRRRPDIDWETDA